MPASRAGRPGKALTSRNRPLSRILNRRAAGELDIFDAVGATLGGAGDVGYVTIEIAATGD
jgi:hypothetical protein